MTREEAIQYAEKKIDSASYRLEMGYLNNGLRQIVSNEYEFFMQALSALRQQEHFRDLTKKVEPLTLDELRQMDGEPVWVVYDEDAGMWALIEVCEESIFLTNNLGGRSEYAADVELEDDGITVYRQKPEEDDCEH